VGYYGRLEEKEQARQLRRGGLSVREITTRLRVSKDSVSRWVRDIQLTDKQLRRLYLNQKTGALRGSIIGSNKNQRRREEETLQLLNEGCRQVGVLTKRDRFIAGVCLYAAEGNKTDGDVAISNTDPLILRFMVRWLEEFLHVERSRMKLYLYLHEGLNEDTAKQFWSNMLDIPITRFGKTYRASATRARLRKVRHVYGVLRVGVSNRLLHRRLMGWVSGILDGAR